MLGTITAFLSSALSCSAPIMYAATGEVLDQRAGVMNLGMEGVMLMGACCGYVFAIKSGSLYIGLLAAMLSGLVIGMLFAFLVITMKADQTVCGLSITIFCTGLSGYIGKKFSAVASNMAFPVIEIPILSDIPLLGPVLFKQNIMVYILYILVFASWFFIYKTKAGLILRTLGERPDAADTVGINVFALRYLYTTVSCIFAAMGGAYLTLHYTPLWADEMTSGKGWIALALVIFATWNPLLVAVGALVFGGLTVLALNLQVAGISVPSQFLNMLPYLCTILVLIVTTGNFGKKKRSVSPKALGVVYDREAR